jgi:hypothetical protein
MQSSHPPTGTNTFLETLKLIWIKGVEVYSTLGAGKDRTLIVWVLNLVMRKVGHQEISQGLNNRGTSIGRVLLTLKPTQDLSQCLN